MQLCPAATAHGDGKKNRMRAGGCSSDRFRDRERQNGKLLNGSRTQSAQMTIRPQSREITLVNTAKVS
jgi:hypothetical protein